MMNKESYRRTSNRGRHGRLPLTRSYNIATDISDRNWAAGLHDRDAPELDVTFNG